MDLIELIPIILVALYYIFRPGKKQGEHDKGRERETGGEQQSGQRSLEDILREVMEGKPRPKPVYKEPKPKPVPEPVYEPEEIPDIYESYTGVFNKEKNDQSGKKLDLTVKLEITEDEEDEIDFDLRQAVINEAILKRPWT